MYMFIVVGNLNGIPQWRDRKRLHTLTEKFSVNNEEIIYYLKKISNFWKVYILNIKFNTYI